MKTVWKVLEPETCVVRQLEKSLGCSPVTATVLANRNIVSADSAEQFLNTDLSGFRAPFSIKDMDRAVERVTAAILRKEHILVFGDYDVDGVSSTALLLEFFRHTGTRASFYIPHRIQEGYGLQPYHITDLALSRDIDLIITVDCGSSNHEAVRAATKHGVDVVITDHHQIPDPPPPACAVVNPKRVDCRAGFEHLAGAGVAFCLLICLRKQLRKINFWKNRPEPNLKHFTDLAALGTVADVVPLVDENRILTRTGLEVINSGMRNGILALIESSGIKNRTADSEDIGYKLAPRLNAAGRLEHASIAVDLLTTQEMSTARKISRRLKDLNEKRQTTEKDTYQQIMDHFDSNPHLLQRQSVVLSDDRWHEGILGIVASRIAGKFLRPTILISTRNGIGKGSGRSIPGLDLHGALSACAGRLEQFGGHPMAAGLQIKRENIGPFSRDFENNVQKRCRPENFKRELAIDFILNFEDITERLLNELESLKPFGEGNTEPLFLAENIGVISSRIVGGRHLKLRLKQSCSWKTVNAIYFNPDADLPLPEHLEKLVFKIRRNRYNGRKNIQLIIEDVITKECVRQVCFQSPFEFS